MSKVAPYHFENPRNAIRADTRHQSTMKPIFRRSRLIMAHQILEGIPEERIAKLGPSHGFFVKRPTKSSRVSNIETATPAVWLAKHPYFKAAGMRMRDERSGDPTVSSYIRLAEFYTVAGSVGYHGLDAWAAVLMLPPYSITGHMWPAALLSVGGRFFDTWLEDTLGFKQGKDLYLARLRYAIAYYSA